MGISIQRRRGTTNQTNAFTGRPGEITVDTTKWVAVVHDGSTVGGYALAKESHTHGNATDSVPGFMSASDKTKLDSISGGTINYQTLQSSGTPQTQRASLNVTSNFTVTDDNAGNRSSIDLSDVVGPGTYSKVTVNSKGRVTTGAQLSAGDIPNLTASQISDFTTAARTITLDLFASAASDVNVNSHKIINLSDPTSASDAATKQYVDTTATGLTFKAACRVGAPSNINISAPGTSIDTVSLNTGDRVLLLNQSTGSQNGIYVFNGASTPLSRALDANTSNEVKSGMFVLVTEGATNADVGFVLSTIGTINLGTTNLVFVPFSSGGGSVSAGNGITVVGSAVSVKSANATRIAVGSSGVDLATVSSLTAGGPFNQFTVDAYGRVLTASAATYQAASTNLSGIAGLSTTGITALTGVGTFATRTIQQGTGISIINGDGVAGNIQIAQVNDSNTQRVRISKNGTLSGTRQELNFIEGTNVTITQTDNSANNRMDVTINASGSGGGAGAPTTSQYVLLANDGTLTNERTLVVGTGLTLTDGGAGNNVTLAFVTDFGTLT
jgi:hypothetical protein